MLWGFGFGGVPTTVLSWGARTEPAANVPLLGGGISAVLGAVLLTGLRRRA